MRCPRYLQRSACTDGQSCLRWQRVEDITGGAQVGCLEAFRKLVVDRCQNCFRVVVAPSGVKLMPHRHQEDQIYTVMSGVFYIGSSDQFDGDTVQAYPLGSVTVLPGNPSHFHWARSGEYVTQVTAIGPLNPTILGSRPRSTIRRRAMEPAPRHDRDDMEQIMIYELRIYRCVGGAALPRPERHAAHLGEAWHSPGRVLDNADRREQRAAHLYACLGHHG
jgi:hypothetical protein